MNWRRRHFMICWAEPYGVVLSYVSEKENGRHHLACIIHCKRTGATARISRLEALAVTVQDELVLQSSCQQYDLAVRKNMGKQEEVRQQALPRVLERIAIDGVDHEGKPRRVEVGLDDGDVIADWQKTLETAAQSSQEKAPMPRARPRPNLTVDTNLPTTLMGQSSKECNVCRKPYTGYGNTCSYCRRSGRRSSLQICGMCNTFSSGFANGPCETCGAPQCVSPLPRQRPRSNTSSSFTEFVTGRSRCETAASPSVHRES